MFVFVFLYGSHRNSKLDFCSKLAFIYTIGIKNNTRNRFQTARRIPKINSLVMNSHSSETMNVNDKLSSFTAPSISRREHV